MTATTEQTKRMTQDDGTATTTADQEARAESDANRRSLKVAVLICGQFRFMDLVYKNIETMIEKFTCDIDFFVSIDHDEVEMHRTFSDDNGRDPPHSYKHVYHHDYNVFKKCPRLLQVVFNKTIYPNVFRNVLNYSHKLIKGLSLLTSHYDAYILLRSDLIVEEPLPIDVIVREGGTFFLNYSHNPYIVRNRHKINGNMIITTSTRFISDLKRFLQAFVTSHDTDDALYKLDYFDVVLHRFLQVHNQPYRKIEAKTHLMLSLCNIIAISGDSGSGKSTLMDALYRLLYDDNQDGVIRFETDRYHKWERGNDMYRSFTHLHPEANYLQKMEDDVYNLKVGDFVCAVDYDHKSGRFTQDQIIHPKSHILLCGLHTLWSPSLLEMINVKIYMDTCPSLIRKWKIIRDVKERGKSVAQVDDEIMKRKKDFMDFIDVQKKDADLIVRFYEEPVPIPATPYEDMPKIGAVACKCAIRHHKRDSILSLLSVMDYSREDDADHTWVKLKSTPRPLGSFLESRGIISARVTERLHGDYYGELQLLVFLLFKC